MDTQELRPIELWWTFMHLWAFDGSLTWNRENGVAFTPTPRPERLFLLCVTLVSRYDLQVHEWCWTVDHWIKPKKNPPQCLSPISERQLLKSWCICYNSSSSGSGSRGSWGTSSVRWGVRSVSGSIRRLIDFTAWTETNRINPNVRLLLGKSYFNGHLDLNISEIHHRGTKLHYFQIPHIWPLVGWTLLTADDYHTPTVSIFSCYSLQETHCIRICIYVCIYVNVCGLKDLGPRN